MSKFTQIAETSHRLSLAAMEEASRTGHRTADIDHLLLALTITDQPAGQVLRSLGITLHAARGAIEDQHGEQLAALGVRARPPQSGPIAFHESGGYEWDDRALAIIQRAGGRGRRGDAGAVLRELLAEPSGLIENVLRRLNTSTTEVLEHLDAADRIPEHPASQGSHHALSKRTEAFVPAAPHEVWALISDPGRLPEWDVSIGTVEGAATQPRQPGSDWVAHFPTHRPDGKPLEVKPAMRRRRVHIDSYDPEIRVVWRVTYPDMDRANARVTDLALAPAAGGTQVTISCSWDRHPDRRRQRLLSWCMRPLTRFILWIQVAQIGSAIGRVFR